MFRKGLETARYVILQMCEALWSVLGREYVSSPNTDEWDKIAVDFYSIVSNSFKLIEFKII